ncbi:hypothetical protein AB9K26_04405 [Psychroserpens sp. XS_ASV72]|uniref:hypothetical protein n=1 Tax=Psychroserpens sp. XS_ASV72 TaxID=3241293 RepID=UPI003518B29E
MKSNFLSLLLCFVLIIGHAQNTPTQHSILGIENHLMNEDFNLKRSGEIYPKDLYEFHTSSLFGKQSIEETTLNFDSNGLLISKTIIKNDALAIEPYKHSSYTYNKGKLVKVNNTDKNNRPSVYFPEIVYDYDSKGKLIKTLYTVQFLNQKTDVYTYNSLKNTIHRMRYDGSEDELKYNADGLIIEKKSTKPDGKISLSTYGYHNGLMLSFQSVFDVNDDSFKSKPNIYQYNDRNDIIKETRGYLGDAVFNYVYDEYHNWIARYNIKEKDLEKNIVIREISYSNGKKTGYRSTTDSKLLEAIAKNKASQKLSETTIPNEGVFWKKKTKDGTFNVFVDGVQLKGKKGSIRNYRITKDVLVFDTNSQRLYRLQDYDESLGDTYLKAKEETLTNNLGYWIKTEDGGALVFDLNGDTIQFDTVFISNEFDPQGNLIGTKSNGEKWVFEDSKNVPEGKIYPILRFNANAHGSSINKAAKFDTKFTWSKNQDGSEFKLFDDGQQLKEGLHAKWAGKDILVIDKPNKRLYRFRDYSEVSAEQKHPAELIEINSKKGFWFKVKDNSFFAYNNSFDGISGQLETKWDTNSIDLLVTIKNTTESYKMLGYKNTKVGEVYPLLYPNEISATKGVVGNSDRVIDIIDKTMGKCTSGDCSNGYGVRTKSNGTVVEAFFKDGNAYGFHHINYENDKISIVGTFPNGYAKPPTGLLIRYTPNGLELIDMDLRKALVYDSKDNSYGVVTLDADAKPIHSVKLRYTNTGNCLLGNCSNGEGYYEWSKGNTYFGEWQNGRQHGIGEAVFNGNESYHGEWQDGKRHGMGVYSWSQNKYYFGEWKNGTIHGKGVMYYKENDYQAGYWENGKFIKSIN